MNLYVHVSHLNANMGLTADKPVLDSDMAIVPPYCTRSWWHQVFAEILIFLSPDIWEEIDDCLKLLNQYLF